MEGEVACGFETESSSYFYKLIAFVIHLFGIDGCNFIFFDPQWFDLYEGGSNKSIRNGSYNFQLSSFFDAKHNLLYLTSNNYAQFSQSHPFSEYNFFIFFLMIDLSKC